jgi:superfamily II DNA or RNA helicase
MTYALRPYQLDLIAGIREAWHFGAQRVAGVMATGGGKTIVFSRLADPPMLIIAHRTELIDQAVAKAQKQNPHLSVGRMQGPVKQWRADIVVGSVQTCSRPGALKYLAARRWELVVIDECFPAGTLVDGRPIESLRPGDMVWSYDEKTGDIVARRVVQTMQSVPSSLVKVHMVDGTSFVCTPNHPILTPLGWLRAGQLDGAYVVSYAHDVKADAADRGEVHLVLDPVPTCDEVQSRDVSPDRKGVLHTGLSVGQAEGDLIGNDGPHEQDVCLGSDDGAQSDGSAGSARQDDSDIEEDRAPAALAWREWKTSPGASGEARGASGLAHRGHRRAEGYGDAVSLQDRYCASDDEGVCGSGRRIALPVGSAGFRSTSGQKASTTRVASVQVLEPGRDGTYGGVCRDGLVYNFEVEGTHTYLVNDGVVAHNCHHIAAASYQTILNEVGAFRPGGPRLLGVTATLDRGDGLSLGDTFEVVAEPQIGLIDLVRQGWLVRPRGIRVRIRELETDAVGKVAGDFNQGRLGAAMHAAMAPQKLVAAWEEHAKGRPTIAFMPTVAISQEVADAFRAAGHRFVHLSDKTPKRDRAAILDAYRRGEVTGLCNVGLFSEGTDLPTTECVIVKMTMSSVSYQQQVGRGLRLHDPAACECPIQPCAFPIKRDCIILDPSGVAKRHTLATLVSLAGAPAEDEIPDELLMYEEDDEPVEKAEETYDAPPPEYEDGDALDHELFDLFGQSETTWLRTNGGTWFVPVPDGFLYLGRYPVAMGEAGWELRWHVAHVNQAGPRSGLISQHAVIDGALAAGDAYIAARPMWQAQRDAPWRQTARGLRSDTQAVIRASELLDT